MNKCKKRHLFNRCILCKNIILERKARTNIEMIKSISRYFVREISTTPIKRKTDTLTKLKKLQADFQCENGKPIWLKGGMCDRILYGTTIVLCYIGVLMTLATIYDNAKPASWKTPTC